MHVQDSRRFAVTEAGIFRSEDGSAWNLVAPGFPPTAFVPAGDAILASGYVAGSDEPVLRISSDQGLTWTPLSRQSSPFEGALIRTFCWHGRYLFAGGDGASRGIYRSADSGKTWQGSWDYATGMARNGLTGNGPYTFGAIGPYLFAGTEQGVFRSSDSGASWRTTDITRSVGNIARIGAYLVAGTSDGILRTQDGAAWSPFPAPWSLEIGAPMRMAAGQGRLYVATLYGLYRSPDSGATWTHLRDFSDPIDDLAADGAQLYMGTENLGLLRSADGGATWTNSGLQGVSVTHLAATTAGLFASSWGETPLSYSTDQGDSWREVRLASDPFFPASMCAVAVGRHLMVGQEKGIFRSSDGGTTWIPGANSLGTVRAFLVDGADVFAGGSRPGILRSADSGATWTPVGPLVPPVTSFARHGSALYAGTSSNGGLHRSSDGGATWRDITPASIKPNINAMAANEGGLFILTPSGLYRSQNGDAWTRIDNAPSMSSIAATASALFAIVDTGRGISVSLDGGAKWSPVDAGLPRTEILSLDVRDGYLFAGLRGASVWRRALSDLITTSLPLPRGEPEGLRLAGVGRNQARIGFSLRRRGLADLGLYDAQGRKTATLLHAVLEAGEHSLACALPIAGGSAQFLRLRADGMSRTRILAPGM